MLINHPSGQPPTQSDILHKMRIGNYSLADAIQKIVHSLEVMAHRLAPDENMNVQNVVTLNKGSALNQGSVLTLTLDDRFNGILFSIYQGSCGIKLMAGSSQVTLTTAQFQGADFFAVAATGPVYVPLPMKKLSSVSLFSDPAAAAPLLGSIIFVRF